MANIWLDPSFQYEGDRIHSLRAAVHTLDVRIKALEAQCHHHLTVNISGHTVSLAPTPCAAVSLTATHS